MKVQVIWNGQVIAECDTTIRLEGNHDFPRAGLDMMYF